MYILKLKKQIAVVVGCLILLVGNVYVYGYTYKPKSDVLQKTIMQSNDMGTKECFKGSQGVEVEPSLIPDVNIRYLNHLESIGVDTSEFLGYATGEIFQGEYGNLGSIVLDILDEMSIGDIEPYIYINTDQTKGYIVNQSKDEKYNVIEVVTQKEKNRTGYIIWEIN